MSKDKRIAVVSPFLDKQHGTERCVAEQLERLSGDYEFHLYSTRVEGVDLARIHWRRIPSAPGPPLFRYAWWFIANHLTRWWDSRFGNGRYDLLYSPGINCLDADIVAVHIVFAEFYRQMKRPMSLRRNPFRSWPRLIHRRLYYHVLIGLEHFVYKRENTALVPVSRKVSDDLKSWYGRTGVLPVVYNGTDLERFSPPVRARLRPRARQSLELDDDDFAILLIGNDWMNKGLACLLSGVERLANPYIRVLVAGQDDVAPYQEMLRRTGLSSKVAFLPVRPDVEIYYAAADAYVGPSLKDAFALPPLEAMACGLPVIVSRQAGVSEIITEGTDGFILENPEDSATLATLLDRLSNEPGLRKRIGEAAAQTARQYSWERHAEEMKARFDLVLSQKHTIESTRAQGET
ncbi:MAG: glycosyltransferase family 4 protein [Candidatus Acidiferrales bacterium]